MSPFASLDQESAGSGIGYLDPVSGGLIDIKEKGLLDGVLMRTCLDKDPVFKKDIRRPQHIITLVDSIGDMVEAPARLGLVAGIGDVIALVVDREPAAPRVPLSSIISSVTRLPRALGMKSRMASTSCARRLRWSIRRTDAPRP